jgi:6,7-dimethyl-8-ribityllumazine synthase
MLKPVKRHHLQTRGATFAIVASLYNSRYVDAMLQAAVQELNRAGAKQVRIIRVPGAYEIPVVVARLAREASSSRSSRRKAAALSAVICLGVILRGETTHAAHIGEAVSRALMDIQVRCEVPVIHEVLLLENEAQARVRCLGSKHNRGTEAAHTALRMAQVFRELSESGSAR